MNDDFMPLSEEEIEKEADVDADDADADDKDDADDEDDDDDFDEFKSTDEF